MLYANKSFCPGILDDQMSQNNKMADFVMHLRSNVENCSLGFFNCVSVLLTLDLKQKMQIVTLEALMGQITLKSMVN